MRAGREPTQWTRIVGSCLTRLGAGLPAKVTWAAEELQQSSLTVQASGCSTVSTEASSVGSANEEPVNAAGPLRTARGPFRSESGDQRREPLPTHFTEDVQIDRAPLTRAPDRP